MKISESTKELFEAMAKFQAEVENPKNTADNPFFKSKYAPLCDVLSLVRPLLSKHGLAVIQNPHSDGDSIGITTHISHSSGQYIESDPLFVKMDKVNAQGAGSAISYARRYSLSAMLGISSEDDDDGNHASQPKAQVKPKTNKPVKPTEKEINDARWSIHRMLIALCEKEGNVLLDDCAKLTIDGKSILSRYASDTWSIGMAELWGKASTGNYTFGQLEDFRSKLHVAFGALKEQVA